MSFLFIGSIWYDVNSITRKKKLFQRQPKVTIIITAFNEEKVILRCLTSVYESEYQNIHVIVANDGSQDKTAQIVRNFQRKQNKNSRRKISLISTPNGGKAKILNHVLRTYVHTSLVMVLDADSILAPQALQRAVNYFTDRRIVALASNVRILKNPHLLSLIQHIEYLLGHQLKKAYTSANNEYIIGGIGSMFRLQVLKGVGYFDTNTITEDIDLTMKIIARGNKKQKVVFGADVLCFTEPVLSLFGLFRQRFRWKFGRFQAVYKQRALLFNSDRKYSKLLTCIQLPFVLFSEASFLLEPIFVCLILYFLVKFQDIETVWGILSFFAFYTASAIVVDQYSSWMEKIFLLIFSPLSYVFFFVISIVEYLTLIKCLWNIPNILNPKMDECAWVPVDRIG